MKNLLKSIPATIFAIASFLPGSAISYTTVNTPGQPSFNNSATTPKAAEKSKTTPKANDSKATNNSAAQKPDTNEMKDPKK